MQVEVPAGIRARYQHHRFIEVDHQGPFTPRKLRELKETHQIGVDPRGGLTVCMLLNEKNALVAMGSATCADADNYSKRIGRDISRGRALKEWLTVSVAAR